MLVLVGENADEIFEDSTDGALVESMLDDIGVGCIVGPFDSRVLGAVDGLVDGVFDGLLDGTVEESRDGELESCLDGLIDGNNDGMEDIVSVGNNEGDVSPKAVGEVVGIGSSVVADASVG